MQVSLIRSQENRLLQRDDDDQDVSKGNTAIVREMQAGYQRADPAVSPTCFRAEARAVQLFSLGCFSGMASLLLHAHDVCGWRLHVSFSLFLSLEKSTRLYQPRRGYWKSRCAGIPGGLAMNIHSCFQNKRRETLSAPVTHDSCPLAPRLVFF